MKLSTIFKFLIIIAILIFVLYYFTGFEFLPSKFNLSGFDSLTNKLNELLTNFKKELSRIKELMTGLVETLKQELFGIKKLYDLVKDIITPHSEESNSDFISARILRVIDGDSVVVEIEGKNYEVRYIGIDAPEISDLDKPAEFMAEEALEKNKELVSGKIVKLEKDVSETDKYDRLLRYVYMEDVMINAELVRLGYAYAKPYPPDVKYDDLLLKCQREAKENKLGLWSQNQ